MSIMERIKDTRAITAAETNNIDTTDTNKAQRPDFNHASQVFLDRGGAPRPAYSAGEVHPSPPVWLPITTTKTSPTDEQNGNTTQATQL